MSVPAVWHSQVDIHQFRRGPTSQILPAVACGMLHAFESLKEPITKAVSWHSKISVLLVMECQWPVNVKLLGLKTSFDQCITSQAAL